MNAPSSLPSRPSKAKLTIAQYYAISDSGALDEFGRTELVDGDIYVMNAQHVPHMRAKLSLYDALRDCLRGKEETLVVGMEATAELDARNAPQPDLFVWSSVPAQKGVPLDALRLVIEIADSSERYDLGRKRRMYAEHGIQEYWVVVLRTGRIERFAEPVGGDYSRHESFRFDEDVAAVTLPEITVAGGTLGI